MNSWDYLSMWNEASWNDAGNPNWDNYVQIALHTVQKRWQGIGMELIRIYTRILFGPTYYLITRRINVIQ